MAYDSFGLVSYCKEMAKEQSNYMWGGLMRIITPAMVDQLAKMYPGRYTAARIAFLKAQAAKSYSCDCVGLIKSYYFGGIGSPKYDAKMDINTTGMYGIAKKRGPINTLPETPGLILYMDGHVGVYIGGGKAVECTWGIHGDGIVTTQVSGRGWTHWLELPYIVYPTEPSTVCDCDCNCGYDKIGYFLYTVLPGDSYWSIAQKFLGNGNRYMEICKLNGVTPTTMLYAKVQLKIPYTV